MLLDGRESLLDQLEDASKPVVAGVSISVPAEAESSFPK